MGRSALIDLALQPAYSHFRLGYPNKCQGDKRHEQETCSCEKHNYPPSIVAFFRPDGGICDCNRCGSATEKLSIAMAQPKDPIELTPIFRERVWGRESLAPIFPNHVHKERIGEVWYTFEENFTSAQKTLGDLLQEYPAMLGAGGDPDRPGVCPILLKFLFTSERLSVQVHPADEYAAKHHESLGKTEAWYIMDAQPPAELAVGFKEPITTDRLVDSAKTGEIEELLDWRTVERGDVIFTPAGTVHAIGAGLTVCEVQENSDITYRLYDYGRPRELHLEHGAKVSLLGPHTMEPTPMHLASGREELVACPYFRIEKLTATAAIHVAAGLPYYAILVGIKGPQAGRAMLIPACGNDVVVETAESEWILTYRADGPAAGITVN